MPVRIHLVRHGETEWSLLGRHTGSTDLPLTAHGEQQARQLAAALHAVAFTQVLASPRRRAQQTAERAGVGAALRIEADLAEWDYGAYEGLTSAQIDAQRPGWNIFRDGCPDGETPQQVAARADRLLNRLRGVDGDVALFTHGHFGRVLAVRWVGWEILAAQHLALSPASASVFGHAEHHADTPVIEHWNDTAHWRNDAPPR